jgi:hypothetical protein
MGVMMLDAYSGQSLGLGPLCREVVRVQIMRDQSGLDLEDALEMIDSLLKETVAREILQISDVLAQKRMLPFRKADRILEFAANR